jgi:hypothetical protein
MLGAQPRLDLSKRIATLWSPWQGSLSRRPQIAPKASCTRRCSGCPHDERRDDGLIPTRRRAEEVDDPGLLSHRIKEPAVIRRVRVGAHECVIDDFASGCGSPKSSFSEIRTLAADAAGAEIERRVRKTAVLYGGGTTGSNPSSSSAESAANLTPWIRVANWS